MKKFIEELQIKGIELSLKGNNLSIKYDKNTDIEEKILNEIKKNKQALLDYLNSNSFNIIPNAQESITGYPVTPSQKRMWVLSHLENVSSSYNISFNAKITGPLNIDVLKQSFNILTSRYEILRTFFKYDDQEDVVKQFIVSLEETELKFSFLDYSSYNSQNKYQKLQDYINLQQNISFDLNIPSLFRISVIKLENESHTFFISLHHIISDGWSMNIMISEIFSIYFNQINNLTLEAKPSLQYKDYAVWFHEKMQSKKFKEAEKFWLNQFDTMSLPLNLPSFKRRPQTKTFNGETLHKEYSADFSQKIKNSALQQQVSLFTILESGLKCLLYRYSNQHDIIVGTPIAGREHPELEKQLGLFINTLALRTIFENKNTFSEVVQKEKLMLLSAYQHQIYPVDELINKLNILHDPSRSALFDVLIVFQNQVNEDVRGINMEELSVNFENAEKDTSNFDMTFTFREKAGLLNLAIKYNTDVYDEYQVSKIFLHFENLLTHVIEDQTGKLLIEEIDFLTTFEREQLLIEFNASKVDYPKEKTVIDLFEEWVEKTPDHLAIVFGEKKLTFSELNQQANQLSCYLREIYKIQSDDLITIKLDGSDWAIVALLGILKSGAAYVPIDPEYPQDRVKYIEEDTKAKVTIDEIFFDTFTKIKDQYNKGNLPIINRSDSLAYVIYTSGTTGNPKGVMISHMNLIDYIFGLDKIANIQQNESFAMTSAITADTGNTSLYSALIYGKTLHIFSKNQLRDIHYLKNYFNNVSVDCIKIITSLWKAIGISLPQKMLIIGGEELTVDTVENIKNKNKIIQLFHHYGPTETTIGKLCCKIDLKKKYDKIPIGKPFSNSNIYILNNSLSLIPVGTVGLLYISGDGISKGYINNSKLTQEKFVDNPFDATSKMYNTGDLVRWLPDGTVEFIGREDSQIKIRGFRIELAEIESNILNYNQNVSQVVIDVQTFNNDQVLVAYYTAKEPLDKSCIISYLQNKIPQYMIPSFFIELDKIPLALNGKIDKRKLPLITSSDLIRKEFIPPGNDIEQKLVEIWQKLLGVDEIGVTDNFFELGGNSMSLIKLLFEINKHFTTNLELKDILKHTDIIGISQIIKQKQNVIMDEWIIPINLDN